jgi:hypothetical protein
VIQLLDRHRRDCAALAARLGVPHHEVPVQLITGAPFEFLVVRKGWTWKEVALWWPARRALLVAEVLGTADAWAVGDGPVGVHPMVRLTPPNGLRRFTPEHLLMGHGAPVHGPDAARAMQHALDRSRRDWPRLLGKLPTLVRTARQL